MERITAVFNDVFMPFKGIVIYKREFAGLQYYTESFDFSLEGQPRNFHPLSKRESTYLAETLQPPGAQTGFLHLKNLMPSNVLHVNSANNGFAIWYTRPKRMPMFFKEDLNIPSGVAHVPALLWKADKTDVFIFALPDNKRPTLSTVLYRAPFFNVNSTGKVCMGDVQKNISTNCSLVDFMNLWQKYFFSSYFTHLLNDTSPVKGNIVQLWSRLISGSGIFPVELLKPSSQTLKSLLS